MNNTRRINSLSKSPFRSLVFLLSFLVLLISIWPLSSPAPVLREINRDEQIPKQVNAIVSEIERSDSIPRDYKTWSLFLVCSQSWMSNSEENLDDLFRNYMTFGKSIGSENLAIWFWRWESVPETEDLLKKVQSRLKELSFYTDDVDGLKSLKTSRAIHEYQDSVGLIPDGKLSLSLLLSLGVSYNTPMSSFVDISRNIEYCKKYNLAPSKSPYVVVTSTYPDLSSDVNDSLIVRLTDLQADEVSELLEVLGDQVVLGRLDQEVIDSASYWRTWETVVDRLFNKLKVAAGYIDTVTFEINTRFFNLKLEGSS